MIRLRNENASKRLRFLLPLMLLAVGIVITFFIVGHKASNENSKSAFTLQPGAGFGPPLSGAAPGDKWWMTSSNASIEISGTVSAFARVSLTLVSTPCGTADIKINEQSYHVKHKLKVAFLVQTDSSGHAHMPVVVMSAFCQPLNELRTLYALVDEPIASLIGPVSNPAVVPLVGFAPPEGTPLYYGYWMTSKLASIQVSGQPSSQVAVSLTLVPTPCGPSEIAINGSKFLISKSTRYVIPANLDATGNALLTVTASSQACTPNGDTRTLYTMVATPHAAEKTVKVDPSQKIKK